MSIREPALKRATLDLPSDLRVGQFREAGSDYVVFSLPSASARLPGSLTLAERDVAHRILTGQSNGSIASARATSVRTVANQVASLFRKLGVASRSELVAEIAGTQV